MGSKPTGQSRDNACAQQIDPLNPAIGQASDGDWPSIITARGRCGRAKAVEACEHSRGKDLHCSRFATPGTTHAAKSCRRGEARKRGSEASSIAVTDVGSDMALSDSCASGQSSESLIPGALLVLPPPRECATLLLQVRQNRPTQGLEKGTLCQHCRTSWDYMHVHRMLPYSKREQQTRYSPRYTTPIHRQARNRRLIYRLHYVSRVRFVFFFPMLLE